MTEGGAPLLLLGDLHLLLPHLRRLQPDPRRRAMMRAALSVLIYSGLRRQEFLDLQVADVDLAQGTVLVRSGKGSKSRVVYVCRACLDAVRDWLAVRPNARHPYLFITDSRRRLGDIGLNRLLKTAKCLADLHDQVIRPHAIRHAAATRLLRNGADLRSIQQFLGHNQLQTTALYLRTDEKQLQRIAEFTVLRGQSQASGVKPGHGDRPEQPVREAKPGATALPHPRVRTDRRPRRVAGRRSGVRRPRDTR